MGGGCAGVGRVSRGGGSTVDVSQLTLCDGIQLGHLEAN